MSDPLARLHARRRLSRLLRQRLRMAAALATEAAETTESADRDIMRARSRLRRYRIARARAEIDCAVNRVEAPSEIVPGDGRQANARAIALLLRRAMDPKDGKSD